VSQTFLDAHPHLKGRAVQIVGQCLATDNPTLFGGSSIDLVGYGMAKYAAAAAYAEAGVKPSDIKVCEVHDCFSTNEMCMIDAMGFSETGTAHKMVRNGDITYGGKMVINPSGGLISKGHPLGATGLAQCAELVWHLRGWANNRLVPGADVALQQNVGLGGAAVVTIFKRADGEMPRAVSDGEVGKINGLGYNPAVEAKGFTAAQVDMVRSRKARSDVALANVDKKVQSRF
jgi:sterol carrier protein 2